MSKVSICIPTYNNPEQVKHLIASIEEQTYKDVEVIITDDSTDKRIEEWIEQEKNQKTIACLLKCIYTHNEKPLGHIYNWNAALRLASGDYIKIMFSDDWFTYKDSLEKLVRLLDDNPQASLAFCGSMQVSPKESYARHAADVFIENFSKDYRYLVTGDEIGAPSAVIYRACECFFDERSTFASDVFLYMRILKKNSAFAYTKEPLISIGIHENQYTCDFDEQDERKFRDYEILYTEYHCEENADCRKFYLKHYVFPYKKGKAYAKSMHIPMKEYRERAREILWWNLTKGYPHALKKRIRKWRKAHVRHCRIL